MVSADPITWLKKPCEGYVVNAAFSAANIQKLEAITSILKEKIGDSVFTTPKEALHITLLDWIAPLVDYDGQDKNALFQQIYTEYDEALSNCIKSAGKITVFFNKIKLSPTTIFIVGSDNGKIQQIRDSFLNKIELLPGTKPPPTIIHSSLARFTKPIELNKVEKVIENIQLHIEQDVEEFRLLHTTREPMLDYEVIKTYPVQQF